MKRRLIVLSYILPLLATTLVISTVSAEAASKAGTKCSKINATSTSGGYKFTCIKSGKKLIWSKGVKLIASEPSGSTPLAQTSASQVPPMPEAPTNFLDLWEKRSGIIYHAWLSASKAISTNKSVLPPLEIFRGPNTPTYISDGDLRIALESVSKLYSSFPMPSAVKIFYYSRTDLEWGITKAKEVMGADYDAAATAHGGPMIKCNVEGDCNDGDAFVGRNNIAYLAVGLSDKPNANTRTQYMFATTETCEFYHSLQDNFYDLNHSNMPNVGGLNASNKPPHWLSVGGENMTSSLIRFKLDYQGFKKEFQSKKSWVEWLGITFDENWVKNYLDLANLNQMWSSNRSGAPSQNAGLMGQFLTEVFVSMKGPGVMLDFHKRMSSGTSFETAFKEIFDSSWNDAVPAISKVILDQYVNGG